MQQFPNYYPQMNNYGQPYNPQQTYMDRLAAMQNYQQNPQIQQPVMQQSMTGINGKVVQSVENITANDVPMDGSMAFFPRQDMQEIYVKSWNKDGNIQTIVYKPILDPNSQDGINVPQNNLDTLNEDFRAFRDEMSDRFDRLEKALTKNTKSTTRTKKEVAGDE